MKFAITSDQIDFYHKQGFIEFEDLLMVDPISGAARFDLWRQDPAVKKMLFKPAFNKIVAELFRTPVLRMGFDLLVDTAQATPPPATSRISLQEMSCVQPLAGALLILLSPLEEPSPDLLLPSKIGSGIFFQPHQVIDWPRLMKVPRLRCLIIGYAQKIALYRLEPRNLYTHEWKKMGYAFGDRLTDATHPILYRS